MTEPQLKGFLGALFDFSFKELITTKVIKLVYILGIGVAALGSIVMLVAGLLQGGAGAASIIVAPLMFLLWVIGLRIWLELVMVIFKIADNTDILAGKAAGSSPPGGEPGA